jgi:hypothetical protein
MPGTSCANARLEARLHVTIRTHGTDKVKAITDYTK